MAVSSSSKNLKQPDNYGADGKLQATKRRQEFSKSNGELCLAVLHQPMQRLEDLSNAMSCGGFGKVAKSQKGQFQSVGVLLQKDGMKDEIAATVFFITRLVKKHNKLNKQQMERFALTLTTILFERYKTHWYLSNPTKGQGFRCIRLNQSQAKDPLLEQACIESNVDFHSLGLPKEMTIWVDPFDVCCRYGEKNPAFTVAHFTGQENDHDISQCVRQAVEKAFPSDYHSSTSSDEESIPVEPKNIPTVSNPNSIYQCSEPFPLWSQYSRRRCYVPDGVQPNPSTAYYLQCKGYKACRPSLPFSYPRVDRYHWVSSSR